MDWRRWHDDYSRPESTISRRLRCIREQVSRALDGCPPGPVRAISLCAGQGDDLLGVLAEHPRRHDVRARLVELDPQNAAIARARAEAAGLADVQVVVGDAALVDLYRDLAPAELVLVCGVFGNLVDADVEATVAGCGQLCAEGGTVFWTRHRDPPDRVPWICDRFERHGFERIWLSEPDVEYGVGVHRRRGAPDPWIGDRRLFTFVGYDELSRRRG